MMLLPPLPVFLSRLLLFPLSFFLPPSISLPLLGERSGCSAEKRKKGKALLVRRGQLIFLENANAPRTDRVGFPLILAETTAMWGGFGGGYGAGAHVGTYNAQFRAFSMALHKPELEAGDKIVLPQSALLKLAQLNIEYPMLFKISNDAGAGGSVSLPPCASANEQKVEGGSFALKEPRSKSPKALSC